MEPHKLRALDQANSTNFMYAAVTIGVLIAVTAVSRGRTSSPLSRFIDISKAPTAANAERSAYYASSKRWELLKRRL